MATITESNKDSGNIIRIPELENISDQRGLGHLFFSNMGRNKDKIAQIDAITGEKDTFGAFRQRCIRAAITMRSKGLNANSTIAIFTTNHLNCFVPMIASLFLGVKPTPLDPSLSVNDATYLIKQINPKIIFVIPEAVTLIEDSVKELHNNNVEIVVFGQTSKHVPFSDYLQPKGDEDNFESVSPKNLKETAIIFFSSGTSGLPKGTCVSHYGFIKQVYNTINIGFDLSMSFLNSSIYWLIVSNFYAALAITGKPRLFLPKFDVKLVWRKIHEYKPTLLFISPYQALEMLTVGKPEGVDTTSLKDINLGGAAILEDQMLKIRKMFPGTRINLSYGMTEVNGFLSCFNINEPEEVMFADRKPTSSGKGIPGFSYKIVNLETEKILGPNQDGELRIKSDFLFSNYYNANPLDVYDSEDWFRTGDVAYYDEDECLYIVDRIKEVMKVKSWHVPPALLENVLLTHPAVKAAVVIGVPHEIDGDHPMGIVVLKEDSGIITPDEIEKYVEGRVQDRQRLRAGVKIVDSLPTNSSGKLKRNEIKKLYLPRK